MCGCFNARVIFKYNAEIWSTYSSARAALLFLLIAHNVLHYPVKAIVQGLKAFTLSFPVFLLITLICTNENTY